VAVPERCLQVLAVAVPAERERTMTQEDRILAHLQAGHSITPAEAYALCGTLALHSRIAALRKRGHAIDGQIITHEGKRWGCYRLASPAIGR